MPKSKSASKAATASKSTSKSTSKPKKLSKIGEWWLKHPHGEGGTYDLRAVMR
jgi:hypothetical protein